MEKSTLTKEQRREKREIKRQKQRENNVLRAFKMHKLRLASNIPSPIRPPAPEGTTYHIGCSGWFYWHWRNAFYPEGLATKDWFAHYAQTFGTVEINASFYSWPTETTVMSWIKQAGLKKFVYTVKVCELITHTKKFEGTEELVKDFGHIATILGDRMGCFLYQVPPSYHYSPAKLKAIVSQLQTGQRNVVEFRHGSWWNEKVYTALKEANLIFCSCSAPRLPDELIKTAEDIYIRFHGKKAWYRHDYTQDELKEWAKRIQQAKAKTVWIYFNNDFGGDAVKNAKALARMLKSKL
ncbi:DUF72 domain-containing protein [Nitrosomonas communis]|uniref:Uncharacterized conserved protein YecE, DUF72 family n=1 Tax=Nitrosomonas communis TaxID=44574 RepID=A0A1I4S383_9PROT|nr:DUF72 domain-containing protein [Nitrosomonas communis]SFM58947.1 Uncharacterized conserved protein YecE, DUF72 family [Nitrosomonas communis]